MGSNGPSGWSPSMDRARACGLAGPAPPGDWFPDVYSDFAHRLLDPERTYPCYFGTRAQRTGNNWFWIVDDRLPHEYGVDALVAALAAFRVRAWTGPVRQSLVVFVGPPDPAPALAAHHARFWALLSALSARDQAPWPPDQPTDPDDPHWQWSFAGEPWFVFAGSPAYSARRSRDLGPCLTMVFQTRRVFQGLAGDTPEGKAAKTRVRRLLTQYDRVPPHPHLGDHQHSSTHKWRQYAIPDDQTVYSAEGCPFRPPMVPPAEDPAGTT